MGLLGLPIGIHDRITLAIIRKNKTLKAAFIIAAKVMLSNNP